MEGVTLGPYELNKIYTGDARVLAEQIPDESVDLIFTDPVYDRIDDYRWLAETAARVLKPDSACLVWCGVQQIKEVQIAIEEHLIFVWWLNYVVYGGGSRLIGYNMFTKWTPLLWANKGKFTPYERILDTKTCHYGSTNYPDTVGHKWAKHPDFMIEYLSAFAQPGDTVADFFCGGGTVPAVAKMLGVNYWACEIDPATADKARQRVAMTQPPLFVVQPEQLELTIGLASDYSSYQTH